MVFAFLWFYETFRVSFDFLQFFFASLQKICFVSYTFISKSDKTKIIHYVFA